MNNKKTDQIFKDVYVASPCSANWDDMVGDERIRYCGSCEKNVYNFSEMSKDEVADLLIQNNYNICGRLYRRADGTILTDDCPVGLRVVRQACRQIYKRMAAGIVLVLSMFLGQAARADNDYGDIGLNVSHNIWTMKALHGLFRYFGDVSGVNGVRESFRQYVRESCRYLLSPPTQMGSLSSYAVSSSGKNDSTSKGK